MLKNALLFFAIFYCCDVFCQEVRDTVFLMNGHFVASNVLDTSANQVTIVNPDNSVKKIQYDQEQLYRVHFANGLTRYYYTQDTLQNNWLSRDEMWMYMKGENDARKGYKGRGALFGSAAAGLLSGLTGSFFAPIIPYGYMALSGLPKVVIKHSTVSDLKNLQSDAYIMGYERVARQRLKTKSLIGGTAGLAAGYIVYFFANAYYPSSINIGFNK